MSITRTLVPPTAITRAKSESALGVVSAIAVDNVSLSVESSGTFTYDNARKRALRALDPMMEGNVQTKPEESTAPRGSPLRPPVLAQMKIAGMQKAQIPSEDLAKYGISKALNSNTSELEGIQRQSTSNNSAFTLDLNSNGSAPVIVPDEARKTESAARDEEVRQRRAEAAEREREREERKQEKEARRIEKEEREKEREELSRERTQRRVELQERQKEREERIRERSEREEEKRQRLAEVDERRAEREARLREAEELREERAQRQIEINERDQEREERRGEREERARELALRQLELKAHEEIVEERQREREEREEERLQRRKEIEERDQFRKEIDKILREHKPWLNGRDCDAYGTTRRITELEITNASLSTELERVKEELRVVKREMETDQKKITSLMDYMALFQLPNEKVADFNRLKNLVVCAQQKLAKASDLDLASWWAALGASQVTEIRYETTQMLLKERNLDIVARNFLRYKPAVSYLVELESRIGLQRDQNYTAFGKFSREVYVTAQKRLLLQGSEIGMDPTTFDALVDFVCAGER